MRIEQLEHLVAVDQHGSLRRAGEQLHLSQPALRESLGKLERELRLTLLDRDRSGTRISKDGRQLLPHALEVLDALDRLRSAAAHQRGDTRAVRVGTVHAATATLLGPAVRAFRARRPSTPVDVVTLHRARIDTALVEGSLDLSLVNVLDGDVLPAGLEGVDLLRGRPVVVLPAEHPLAARDEVLTTEELRSEPLVMMRGGYVMHRYLRRLFGSDVPQATHTTDGAEMAKALVAEGLGVTVMPDYAVVGGALHRSGQVAMRGVAGDGTRVTLQLRQRTALRQPLPVRELVAALRAEAARHEMGAVQAV
ncbi:LysR family transcriptional regulator [Nocardioides sp.]|uniref:LysR family transcriptional regulator n=1 Tax=Nocardioides sp. TaxID=35761 RepID=UPI001A228A84|nr:LysR family transcriptional regulator [Nocardioides sp.]MBJ7357772.1 LysR family transcriptional regulator [Nocardioides sp.]